MQVSKYLNDDRIFALQQFKTIFIYVKNFNLKIVSGHRFQFKILNSLFQKIP